MTRFVDGPAKGAVLQLSRAPFVLRVVIAKDGEVDALDQPNDEAKAEEAIWVYRLTAPAGSMHICRSPRHQSGWCTIADYALLDGQPCDDHLRTTAAWNKWCNTHKNDLIAGTWAETAKGMTQ